MGFPTSTLRVVCSKTLIFQGSSTMAEHPAVNWTVGRSIRSPGDFFLPGDIGVAFVYS